MGNNNGTSITTSTNKDGLIQTSQFFHQLGNFIPVPSLRSLARNTNTNEEEDEKAYLTDLQPILLKRQSPWPVPLSLVYTTTDIEGRLLFLYTLFPTLPLVLYDRYDKPFSDQDTELIMDDIKRFGEHHKVYMEAKKVRDTTRREARKKAREEAKIQGKTTGSGTTTTSTSSSTTSSSSSSSNVNPSLHASTKHQPFANESLDPDPNYDIDDNEIPSTVKKPKTPEEIEDEKIKELENLAKPPVIPRLYRIKFTDPTGLQVFVERAGEPATPTVSEKAAMRLQSKKDSSPYFKPAVAVTGILPNGFANPLPRHDMSAIIHDHDEFNNYDEDDIDNNKDRKNNPKKSSSLASSFFASSKGTQTVTSPPLKLSGVSFVGLLIPLPSVLGEDAAMLALKFWKRLGHDRFSLRNPPHDHALCTDGLVVLAFQRNPETLTPWLLGRTALLYQAPDADPVIKALKQVVPDVQLTRTLTDSNQGYLYSFEAPPFHSTSSSFSQSSSSVTDNDNDVPSGAMVTYPGPLFVLATPKSNKIMRILTYTVAVLFVVALIVGFMGILSSPSVRKMMSDYYTTFSSMVRRWTRSNAYKSTGKERPSSPYQKKM